MIQEAASAQQSSPQMNDGCQTPCYEIRGV